jgi:hypothetical protein
LGESHERSDDSTNEGASINRTKDKMAPRFDQSLVDQELASSDMQQKTALSESVALADYYKGKAHEYAQQVAFLSEEAAKAAQDPVSACNKQLAAGGSTFNATCTVKSGDQSVVNNWSVAQTILCNISTFLVSGYAAASPQFVSAAGSPGQKNTLTIVGASLGIIPIALSCSQQHGNAGNTTTQATPAAAGGSSK